ncbi:hypothetical protein AX15_001011 [Amanita polypyramis BW_CC]|nr:hypothetical protein AX15_001011 [Amanita polypyramis BW_CC]
MNVACNVPVEVLGPIFLLLCEEPIKVAPDVADSVDNFPWALGSVCKHWRHAFISYAPIWSSIDLFDYCLVGEDCAEEVARRLAIFLQRSNERPLTVALYISNIVTIQAWKLLLSCSYRWRTADIRIWNRQLRDDLLALKGKTPLLENLRITTIPDRVEEDFDAFEIAPRLTRVELECEESLGRWILPWSQLTGLDITLTSLFDVPPLLQRLQNIEKLFFSFQSIEEENEEDLGLFEGFSARLEHIRVLQAPFPVILSWIEAPLLEELRLGDPDNRFHRSLPHEEDLVSLIYRSKPPCQIRRLVLRGVDIPTAKSIIIVLNDVEELHICAPVDTWGFDLDYPATTYVYNILSTLANSDNHIYLPALRRLAITFDPEKTILKLVKTVTKLLRARGKRTVAELGVVPLENLTIRFPTWNVLDPNPQLLEALATAQRKWPRFVKIEY